MSVFRRLQSDAGTWVWLAAAAMPGATAAQDAPERLRVFLDCQGDCDTREFRTVITYVDWVLEPNAADVHVIKTDQDTGAGTRHIFDFVGRLGLQGIDDRLVFTSSGTDTRDEVVRGMTRVLSAGLVRYMAHRGLAGDVEIRGGAGEGGTRTLSSQNDPWNHWVFELGFNVSAEGEELQNDNEIGVAISANRTTPEWRIEFEVEGDFERSTVTLSDGRKFHDNTDDWEAGGLIVRSIGGQWSSGGEISASTSTEFNRRFAARSAAALEYSIFPYEEANRRRLIFQYQVGVSRFRYAERTIFDKVQETVTDHALTLAFETRQPWGDMSLSGQFSNYLHDFGKNRTSAFAGVDVRLFRGFELEIDASYERVRDQIYLSAEELSDEEILVQRRQLPTSYEYELSFGISYQFGSVFNNIVNNRIVGT